MDNDSSSSICDINTVAAVLPEIKLNCKSQSTSNTSIPIQNDIIKLPVVIAGCYGLVLRKRVNKIFGSYWTREYCMIQSNILVFHKVKYPFYITKSISVASIIKCEASLIDSCVFSIFLNKSDDSCMSSCRKKKVQIKLKCTSTVDMQRWVLYINNNIKSWKNNKNSAKNLISNDQYIERSVAEGIIEKVTRKLKKSNRALMLYQLNFIIKKRLIILLSNSFKILLLNKNRNSVVSIESNENECGPLILKRFMKEVQMSVNILKSMFSFSRIVESRLKLHWDILKKHKTTTCILHERITLRDLFHIWKRQTLFTKNQQILYEKSGNIKFDRCYSFYFEKSLPVLISNQFNRINILASIFNKRLRFAWNCLYTIKIQERILIGLYRYNQINSLFHILEKIWRVKVIKAFFTLKFMQNTSICQGRNEEIYLNIKYNSKPMNNKIENEIIGLYKNTL
ncbi:PH domain-containing protein [Cryptosporidium muris RN66]|uniref:PH domain-containing protein n=1 Tax=Cryptosporidium muris (strain RN66) TaxID=441375 RepID=B6AAA2_CRYMR|nr:PH domain-containing protein [Cryptosporidium muris RN66]EEA05143.1 PH domain-containing protein [Cryptosporidium muris RN66]|eukprot:XP_002139492.1 PH domain-containing protein [Cryptosporidium muris RN66]